MIHTASFFEEWNFGSGRLVSIAIQAPDWFAVTYGERELEICELLQPDWHLVNSYRAHLLSPDKYKKIYWDLLKERLKDNGFDFLNGYLGREKTLELLGLQDSDTLLCWEKHGKFCHRILVADLLRKNGIEVVRK